MLPRESIPSPTEGAMRRRGRPRAGFLPLAVLAAVAAAPGCGGGAGGLARQASWVAAHLDAPVAVKEAVLGKKLMEGVGMTPDAVVASWGEPDNLLDLGGGDARWTYRRRQLRNNTRLVIEYTLIFNRGYLMRVLQEEHR